MNIVPYELKLVKYEFSEWFTGMFGEEPDFSEDAVDYLYLAYFDGYMKRIQHQNEKIRTWEYI